VLSDGYRWDGRSLSRLPGLDGQQVQGTAVNDRGVIAGYAGTTPEGWDPHAVLLLPRR
jgi:hypothetical protein